MLNNMNYLSIFFRLLNFTIICFIFYYVFKKYLSANVKKQIDDRLRYLQNIKHEYLFYQKNILKIDNETIEQQKFTQDLINKLNKWKNFVENEKEKKLIKLNDIKKNIELKQTLKSETLSKKIFYDSIVPKIVKENESEIKSEFNDLNKVVEYQNNVLNFLKNNL